MDTSAKQYDIKLIKYGLIFFYDPAVLKYNSSTIEIIKQNGETEFKFPPNEIKRVLFNPSSGIFTLKTKSGQKVNIAFKGDFTLNEFEPVTKFRTFLKESNIKGWVLGYMTIGRL